MTFLFFTKCPTVIYSEKLDKYYNGSTANLQGRLYRHNTSNKGFTSTGKPWIIKYSEEFKTKTEASQREFQLKRWKDIQKLEELIVASSEHPGLTGRVGGFPKNSGSSPTLKKSFDNSRDFFLSA